MKLKRFLNNSDGGLAVMFSLALVPLMVAAGVAMDMSRKAATDTLLQGATDAAAFAGASAKNSWGSGAAADAKVEQLVKDYLASNGANDALNSISTIDAGLDPKTGMFAVRMTGKIDTTFMSLVGFSTMDVGAYSEVDIGGQALEVALVLDNTASMSSEGRMDALKSSSKALVDKLMTAKSATGYLKIGIVPFADYVNVGMSNRNAPWMNVPKDSSTVQNVCSVTYPNAVSSNCHDEKGTWNNDGVPTPYTYQVCDWDYGKSETTCADQTYYNKWYGCVGSRTNPMDLGIGSIASPYPGIQNTSCPKEITHLTDSKATLDSEIDAMNPVGETYIPSGLLWGWNLLDAAEPITGAKSATEMASLKGVKSLVLMTDGDNTKSPDYPYHWGSDTANADSITASLCENIKSEGIVIYTVAFKVSKQSSKDLLTACASSADQAFNADNDAGLMVAFGDIATSLAQLRLTK
jgi:Flp pilus assembly protein TadG